MTATLTSSGTLPARTLSRRLLRLLLAVLLLGTLTPMLTSCEEEEENETPAPDRTPYTGEWAGELTWVNIGKSDNLQVTLEAPAGSPETMQGSVFFVTDQIRRPITVQWDRRAARWNVTFNYANAAERNAVLSLNNNALRVEYDTDGNNRYFSVMNDARDQWVGSWTGGTTCVNSPARNVNWTIRKGSSRIGLEIANSSAPNTIITQGELRQNTITGNVPIGGVAHSYSLSYSTFLGTLIGSATAPNNDPCNLGLNK